MDIIKKIAGKTITEAINAVADGASQIIGKFVKDPNQAALAAKEITLLAMGESKDALEILEKTVQVEIQKKTEIMKSEIQSDDVVTRRTRPIILLAGLGMILLDWLFSWINAIFFHIDMTKITTIPPFFIPVWSGMCTVYIIGRSVEKRGVQSKIINAITGAKI